MYLVSFVITDLKLEKFEDDKEGEKKETHMRAPCTTKKLNDLEELELIIVHEEIIKKTPSTVFKDLIKFNMHSVLLEILLLHWYREGNNGNFKLGHHIVEFNVKDVTLITGLHNEGTPIYFENRKPTCKWCTRHLTTDAKVDQRNIIAKLEVLLENSRDRQ